MDEKDTFFEAAQKFAEREWMISKGYDVTRIEGREAGYNHYKKWIAEGGELMINYANFTNHMFEICLSPDDPNPPLKK